MSGGDFLVLGTITHFPAPDDDLHLLRVDERGGEVWTRTWSEGRASGHDLIASSDGNYLVAGSYAPPDETDHLCDTRRRPQF